MNRILMVSVAVMCLTFSLYAKDPAKETKNGTICDAQCVSQVSGRATCDPTCTDKSGKAVFVDDNGTVTQVANQDVCKEHMGKHVKMTATPTDEPGTYHVQSLQDTGAPQQGDHSY